MGTEIPETGKINFEHKDNLQNPWLKIVKIL